MIETIIRYSFNGIIKNDNKEDCPALVDLEYDEYDPRILQCKLTFEDISKWPNVLKDLEANPRVVGKSPDGKNIVIRYLGFSGTINLTAKHGEANLLSVSFILGSLGGVPFTKGTYNFSITLLNAPAVRVSGIQESSYLGEINKGRKHDDGILLQSDLGKICIGNYYELKEGRVGIEYADVQIEKTQIIINNSFDKRISIEESIACIEKEIEDILTILTFVNRTFIHWFDIELTFRDSNRVNRNVVTIKRKHIRSINDSDPEPLFGDYELRRELLASLLEAYRKSQLRTMIERSIIFLTASYERETIESQLQAVYSAIEAIANPLSIKNKLYYSEKGAPKKARNINPISKRIFNLVKIYEIDCWDFGDPGKTDLKFIIEAIFKRRNKMMHTGEIGDLKLLYADLIRLRAICERIILAELGFIDDDRYFHDAYRELRSLSK